MEGEHHHHHAPVKAEANEEEQQLTPDAREESTSWHRLQLDSPDELRLHLSLPSGQSFRWSTCLVDGREAWAGVIRQTAYFLHQPLDDPALVLFRYLDSSDAGGEGGVEVEAKRRELEDYFQLGMRMEDAWNRWTAQREKDPPIVAHFRDACLRFRGLRTLRTDPVECLFSFICSQNNNIARITQMVNALCARYGDKIGEAVVQRTSDTKAETRAFYAFPTLETLAGVPERALRDMSFGYRAKYIPTAAQQVLDKDDPELGAGRDWLYGLRERAVSRERAQKELTSLLGVGKKVADCVCLVSLDKLDAIPVDTHVRQIAQRFMPSLKRKANSSMTDALYGEISSFFKDHFGADCGWAHSLLFAAELPIFRLPAAKRKAAKKEEDEENENENENDNESEATVKVVKREKKAKRETAATAIVATTTRRRSSRLSGKRALAVEEEVLVVKREKEGESGETPITSRRKKRRASVE